MESNDQSEMIERYLLNRLTEEEKRHFENLMNEDPALFEEVNLQRELFELASDEDFQTIFPHLKAQEKAYLKKNDRFKNINKTLFRITLAVLVLMVLYFFKHCALQG